jgi:hypothetical protein
VAVETLLLSISSQRLGLQLIAGGSGVDSGPLGRLERRWDGVVVVNDGELGVGRREQSRGGGERAREKVKGDFPSSTSTREIRMGERQCSRSGCTG